MCKAKNSVRAFSVATKASTLRLVDDAELDPIFAAIATHRKAFLNCEESDDATAAEEIARLSLIENDALDELVKVTPTTLGGVMALSQYSAELTALFNRAGWSRPFTHPDDGEKLVDWSYYVHRNVADAVSKLTAVQRFPTSA
jgi:hypothetical protein